MSQIITRSITDNAVGAAKIRLENAAALRARNAANSGDVSILDVSASDIPEFLTKTQHNFTPTVGADIANKTYVDSAVGSSAQVAKQAVATVSLANITLSGEQTIDGVLTSASRILVAGQTTAANNGIYVTAAGAWSRATDSDTSAEVMPGLLVNVASGGTSYGNTLWKLDTNVAITLGTTALSFLKESRIPNKQALTLNGTDITNQYKDLAFTIKPSSLSAVFNGLSQRESTDYTLSTVGGVTRFTFAGDLATGGASALISGDILYFQYEY